MNRYLHRISWRRLRAYLRHRSAARRWRQTEPAFRSELYSAAQLERHGGLLAAAHRCDQRRPSDRLLKRLADNEAVLIETCELLTEASREQRRLSPASEWLLDNFYLIEEQIRTARRHLPKGYCRQLPRLAAGPSIGLPRVYDLALEIISHGDGRVDAENVRCFVAAYQRVTPLKLGELWAIPIMLRLALIENLRRVAVRIVAQKRDRRLAAQWAERVIDMVERNPKNVVLTIADMARSEPPMSHAFVAELSRRLHGRSTALTLPLSWTEHWLADAGHSIEHMVQQEAHQQAADQVSVSNSIGGLRALAEIDWRELVEALSAVERTLRQDPVGVHADMTFASRDQYRHAVEDLARRSRRAESDVAQAAIALADAAPAADGDPRRRHVGFYLLDDGRSELERRLGLRLHWLGRLRPRAKRLPVSVYLAAIAMLTVPFATALTLAAEVDRIEGWPLIGIAAAATVVGSQFAVALVNWLVTQWLRPEALPSMDFSGGLPAQARTLVVIPTMLTNLGAIDALVEALEVRYLANRVSNLSFALLTDFVDASSATTAMDDSLVRRARAGIIELNARHADAGSGRFYLLHRPRQWNPQERVWMGRERKRGKLADLNRLLRGSGTAAFAEIVGDPGELAGIRYVITLDTDTQLPRGSAVGLVGAMEHPLNQPLRDDRRRVIARGFGILQPRIGVSLPSVGRSPFATLFGSEAGVDPYTRAVSDVYQDAFGEGSFIGKGIYDVDAFEFALGGRFPDNAILSHDLIEGCHARAGLAGGVMLYEEYPSTYYADASRRHRWIRGDWQLLPWLLPWVPGGDDRPVRNFLSLLSAWKLFDNLRRSLVAAAMVALLGVGWAHLREPGLWTLWLLTVYMVPPLVASLLDAMRKPREVDLYQHVLVNLRAAGWQLLRTILHLAWLPHEAYYSLDAIMRSLWRLAISRRHLLEWRPSGDLHHAAPKTLAQYLGFMWIGPLLAAAGLALLWQRQAVAEPAVLPVLGLWLLSPLLAWWISRERMPASAVLDAGRQRFLRQLSRKTWAFFETYVGPDDHWLPPDNVQEHPLAVVAHRTSPTNIGMALLSTLAARDFGYIGLGRLLDRIGNTLRVMGQLERFRGHFYNWYDTRTLSPLAPHYVSTVDSGNLVGHTLTLRQGLLALADQPILLPRLMAGLDDTLGLVEAALADRAHVVALVAFRERVRAVGASGPAGVAATSSLLDELSARATSLQLEPAISQSSEARFWTDAVVRQLDDAIDDLRYHFPDGAIEFAGASPMPTLRALSGPPLGQAGDWPAELSMRVRERALARLAEIDTLAREIERFSEVQYDFLYDPTRRLLAIGYEAQEHRRDPGHYDLLASEARLANFIAIAQDKLPQESWFSLGRLLTSSGGSPVLLSWSGSMFEYLMPMLVMPSFDGTLLERSGKAAVARQVAYGTQKGVPWGVSESGYNMVDVHQNYQYRAFGVPGLGLQRGLSDDLVIAPYASALALMVDPVRACDNLRRLSESGIEGRFGMYEAVDYTPSRVPRGQGRVIVRSFMAHHQGMTLLSLAYALLDKPMQRRFESDPRLRATLLLLQERVPKAVNKLLHSSEFPQVGAESVADDSALRVIADPDNTRPAVRLLSNGNYHVMVNSAGSGYSRRGDMAVTRWREDGTSDRCGAFCFLRDMDSGEYWSTSLQPACRRVEDYKAIFSESRAEFRGVHREFDVHVEIGVSPEDDIELRRVKVSNRGRARRTIEITSYAEVVLAPAMADALHPAFNKLFVQTELVRPQQAILCTRRPRSATEPTPWLFHLLAVHDADAFDVSYETDRARFIGRGNSLARPAAMSAREFDGSEGPVLDPIVAIRCRVTLDPDQSVTADLVTGVGDGRDACLDLVDKYRDRRLADRVFDLAWTHNQVMLRQLDISHHEAQVYERLAGSILYATPALRADPTVIGKNHRDQSGLWGQAVSGDLPVVLVSITAAANIELVRQMIKAHAYWRQKGLAVDLVIWNEDRAGYRRHLEDLIMGLVGTSHEAGLLDKPGGIFVRPAHQVSSEDRVLMQAVARVIVSDDKGTLAEQVGQRMLEPPPPPALAVGAERPDSESLPTTTATPRAPAPRLFDNGVGGFSADGSEYIISLAAGTNTPAPWANVLANADFGSVVSESGSAYTWCDNAHEFRLTPWNNDPVMDDGGEALYLRDEETGAFWSPSPWPRRGQGGYLVRHGFGYTVFEHDEGGIESELWTYVAVDRPVKFCVLKLRNRSGRRRQLSATGYVDWVLGDLREKTAMHVVTGSDGPAGALFAHNPFNIDFPGRVGFFDAELLGGVRTVTGDRSEFIGRNRSLRDPAALGRARLSGRLGAGMDPCAAIALGFTLEDGETREIVFRLGAGRSRAAVQELARSLRKVDSAENALAQIRAYWQQRLSVVQVRTPDPALDALANGWLLYQTIACRFNARSGYYQSGGAFGFRDQLQDSMAMLHVDPAQVRNHLLRCAAHQFPEGDVQHWWHPPTGRGVRTRCSDDFLWLPLAVCRYIDMTGDDSVLDERINYVEGRLVNSDEESYYDLPIQSGIRETLYQHCVRALRRAAARGTHGLPLIGSGDWNDGMNRVGAQGRGESVWLAFFLCEVLTRFAALAARRDDAALAEQCLGDVDALKASIEEHAWDGAWYRRAFDDAGAPLGSAGNEECQIDSVAQSWSVLSGGADLQRARRAMQAVEQRLLRRDAGIVQLLDPPFDRSATDPGYIKGYLPGVRENGGQYTHAAIWTAMAFARLGDRERAWEVFDMINPVNHGRSAAAIATYKVEPYVVAADVYARAPHTGRGGWTWYTGSAGWMYRLVVESLLGLEVERDRLRVRPLLRAGWAAYELRYRFGKTVYRITVTASQEPQAIMTLDGALVSGDIPLRDDGVEHDVQVRWPAGTAER